MSLLNRLKISAKLAILVGLGILSVAVTLAILLPGTKAQLMRDRVAKIRAVSEAAQNIAEGFDKRAKAGEFSDQEAKKRFADVIRAMWYDGKKEYLLVYDFDGKGVINPPRPDTEGQDRSKVKDTNGYLFIQAMVDAAKAGGGVTSYVFPRPGSDVPEPKVTYTLPYRPWGYMIGTGVYVDDVEAEFRGILVRTGIAVGLLILITTAIATLVWRNIAKDLAALGGGMRRLADGELEIAVPGLGRADEIGGMARSVQVLKDKALEALRLRTEQEALKLQAERDKRAQLLDVADSFEADIRGVAERLSSSATQMQSTAQNLSSVAEETQRQASTVAAATIQASANVQTVASASEELTISIKEIGRQTSLASGVARKAIDSANSTDELVRSLDETAREIGAVVGLITEIANQTNLLSLNATIEAARAGEAGKGFAVVATEVKALANQTREATDQIGRRIEAMQNVTSNAVEAIAEIRRVVDDMGIATQTIAAAVEQQDAATAEISRNVQQAAQGTEMVSENIEQVSQAANDTGQSSGHALQVAGDLARQSELLNEKLASFITRLRTA